MCGFLPIHEKLFLFLFFISQFINRTFPIIYVSKTASVGQACWQATFASPSFMVLPCFLAVALAPCSRCTEATFFHNASTTNGYIRIQYHSGNIVVDIITTSIFVHVVIETIRLIPISPIESSYFIRGVIGTISSTDATIISHLINSFAAMEHLPDKHFRKARVAMLTYHRLKQGLNRIGLRRIAAK